MVMIRTVFVRTKMLFSRNVFFFSWAYASNFSEDFPLWSSLLTYRTDL